MNTAAPATTSAGASNSKCGETKCVLLDKDPLYDAFALERHVDAVNATMRAMLWLQRRSVSTEVVGH